MVETVLGSISLVFEGAPRDDNHEHLGGRIHDIEVSLEVVADRVGRLANEFDTGVTQLVDALTGLQVCLGAVLAYMERDQRAVSVRPMLPYYLFEGATIPMAIDIIDDATTVIPFVYGNRSGGPAADPTNGTETLTFDPDGAFWGTIHHDSDDTLHITPVLPAQMGAVSTATYRFTPSDGSAELTFVLPDLTITHDAVATTVHANLGALTTVDMESPPVAAPVDAAPPADAAPAPDAAPPADAPADAPTP